MSNVSFKTTAFLLSFCLDKLSIVVSGVLKSLAIVLVLIYPIISVNMLYIFRYSCIRCLCVNESYILFLFWSLYHHIMTFLVYCYNLCYKVCFILCINGFVVCTSVHHYACEVYSRCCGKQLLLFIAVWHSIVNIGHLSILLLMDIWVISSLCYYDKTAMYILSYDFWWTWMFISFESTIFPE